MDIHKRLKENKISRNKPNQRRNIYSENVKILKKETEGTRRWEDMFVDWQN